MSLSSTDRPIWHFIKDAADELGHLPIIHSTDLYCFKTIQEHGELAVQPCDVYVGESLLYFFYGRPSYRPHLSEGPLKVKSFAPVCMVFNHDLAGQAIRIMPFDSGAFHHGRIHPPMHPAMPKSVFELAVDANAPTKLIKVFYGSEKRYLQEDPISVDSFDPSYDFELDAYYKLIRIGHNRALDERVSSIELQYNKNVAIAGVVQAVILPASYLDRPGIREQIEGWGATAVPYRMGETFRPIELYGVVVDKLQEYLQYTGKL